MSGFRSGIPGLMIGTVGFLSVTTGPAGGRMTDGLGSSFGSTLDGSGSFVSNFDGSGGFGSSTFGAGSGLAGSTGFGSRPTGLGSLATFSTAAFDLTGADLAGSALTATVRPRLATRTARGFRGERMGDSSKSRMGWHRPIEVVSGVLGCHPVCRGDARKCGTCAGPGEGGEV